MILKESIVEDAALTWFGELCYAVGHGLQMTPGEPAAERDSFGEVVLMGRLCEAIRKLNLTILHALLPWRRSNSGDLIQLAGNGQFDLIAHGCNSYSTTGAGIARAVMEVFPSAFEADEATKRGDRAKLGSCSFAVIALETSNDFSK